MCMYTCMYMYIYVCVYIYHLGFFGGRKRFSVKRNPFSSSFRSFLPLPDLAHENSYSCSSCRHPGLPEAEHTPLWLLGTVGIWHVKTWGFFTDGWCTFSFLPLCDLGMRVCGRAGRGHGRWQVMLYWTSTRVRSLYTWETKLFCAWMSAIRLVTKYKSQAVLKHELISWNAVLSGWVLILI